MANPRHTWAVTDNLYKDYYRRVAPIYNNIRLDRDIEISATSDIVNRYIKQEHGTILDIGCGTGRYSSYLEQQGYDIVGVDISPEQLQNATKSIPLMCASATNLPFEDNRFVCCLMILILQQLNFEERRKAIHEAYRVLIQSGNLIIKTRSHEDIHKYPFKDIFPSAIPVNLQRYPHIPILISEMEESDFKLVDVVPTFSEQPMEASDLLYSTRNKHNTTLALISPDEFESGCLKLKRLLNNTKIVNVPHYHTVLIFTKV